MSALPDTAELRKRAVVCARQFMETQLGLPVDANLIERLGKDDRLRIIEFAHTPHLGHLGFFRMLIAAIRLAAERDDRVLLLIFNDHVLANALPTIRHIPLSRDGKEMEKPPGFGVAKADRSRPLYFVPAPTPQALGIARDALRSVLLYERSRCHAQLLKAEITRLTDEVFQLLTENATAVENFSAWCIRTLLLLLERGESFRPVPILILVGSHLVEIMPEHFALALSRRDEIVKCQNTTAALTNPPWPEWSRLKPVTEAYFPGWILCEQCREATDNVRLVENHFEISCRNHQFSHEAGLPPRSFKFSPKVVLRQPLASLLNLEHRVCGNRLGYWQVADELVQTLFSTPPPPRVPVTGGVRFDGMAGMSSGAPALLRVLAEMPVPDLLNQLSVPNDAEVIVRNRPAQPEPSADGPLRKPDHHHDH